MAEKRKTNSGNTRSTQNKTKTQSNNSKSKSANNKNTSRSTTTQKSRSQTKSNTNTGISTVAKKQIVSCVIFALAIFLLFVILIPSGVSEGETNLWQGAKNIFFGIFGFCSFAIVPIMVYLSVSLAKDKPLSSYIVRLMSCVLGVICLSTLCYIFPHSSDFLKVNTLSEQISIAWQAGFKGSGVVGAFFGGGIALLFGKAGSIVTTFILLFVAIMIITGTSMSSLFEGFSSVFGKVSGATKERFEELEKQKAESPREPKKTKKEKEYRKPKSEDIYEEPSETIDINLTTDEIEPIVFEETDETENQVTEIPVFDPMPIPDFSGTSTPAYNPDESVETEVSVTEHIPADIPISRGPVKQTDEVIDLINKASEDNSDTPEVQIEDRTDDEAEDEEIEHVYVLPDVECLAQANSSGDADIKEELTANANKLVETLRSFNIETKIVDIARGPSVTRYEIQPAPGIKISRIANLSDDIAMNLAASGVRIEAPIPNKAAVGIEIPNRTRLTVSLREIIDSPQFKNATSKLNVALGKDISGNVTCTDLAKMPHLLIAGTTGSGKSVCLNAMIISILFNSNPDEVKLIMIDPKQVEFTVYRDIPHLMVPVVSDPRKAAGALAWAVSEMTKRYKMFSEKGVRDIKGYNKMAAKDPEMTPMYQICIFIDELSDLMMVAQNEVEDSICRLAQMARAAGMHLVIATQRPSVNVITGIIKANIPSRIALFVSSQVDSRTIIDTAGAEKLLGNGDMLFNPVGVSKPVRLQGCYVSDEEVERVVDFIKSQGQCEYDSDVMEEIEKQAVAEKKKEGYHVDADASPDSGADEETMRAVAVVVENQLASTTLLQRKLKIGYAKAARIMDELEEKGIIGPFEGSKPRKVLMTKQQYNEMIALNGGNFVAADGNNEE